MLTIPLLIEYKLTSPKEAFTWEASNVTSADWYCCILKLAGELSGEVKTSASAPRFKTMFKMVSFGLSVSSDATEITRKVATSPISPNAFTFALM